MYFLAAIAIASIVFVAATFGLIAGLNTFIGTDIPYSFESIAVAAFIFFAVNFVVTTVALYFQCYKDANR